MDSGFFDANRNLNTAVMTHTFESIGRTLLVRCLKNVGTSQRFSLTEFSASIHAIQKPG